MAEDPVIQRLNDLVVWEMDTSHIPPGASGVPGYVGSWKPGIAPEVEDVMHVVHKVQYLERERDSLRDVFVRQRRRLFGDAPDDEIVELLESMGVDLGERW